MLRQSKQLKYERIVLQVTMPEDIFIPQPDSEELTDDLFEKAAAKLCSASNQSLARFREKIKCEAGNEYHGFEQ